MPLHRVPFFFLLRCLVVPTAEMRDNALPWFPSFFQSSKNGDCTLHAAQSHGCELCMKNVERGFRRFCPSLHALSVTICLGRLMPW